NDVAYLVGGCRHSGRRAGHDDAVGEKELGGPGGLGDRDVRGYRVSAVLLLDVGEYQHSVRANRPPVAKQLAGARLDQAFVRHVRIPESLDTDEVRARGVRDGERLAIRGREHLDAEDEAGFALHGARYDGHGRGDLGADTALEIRPVVHVLEAQRREPGVAVDSCLGQRLLYQRLDRPGRGRSPRKGADVQHADEGARSAEARRESRHRIPAGWRWHGSRLPPERRSAAEPKSRRRSVRGSGPSESARTRRRRSRGVVGNGDDAERLLYDRRDDRPRFWDRRAG